MKKQGWKINLGGDDSAIKRQIFGTNSADLYNYNITADVLENLGHDKLAEMKDVYRQEGVERNNRFYGYVNKNSKA